MKTLPFFSLARRRKKNWPGLVCFVCLSCVRCAKKHVMISDVGVVAPCPPRVGDSGQLRLLSGVTLRRWLAVIMDGNTLSSAAFGNHSGDPGGLFSACRCQRRLPKGVSHSCIPLPASCCSILQSEYKKSCADASRGPQTCSRRRDVVTFVYLPEFDKLGRRRQQQLRGF